MHKKTILLVDDNPQLRRQLVRLTKEVISNWKIIEADSYSDAVEKINDNQISILFSDLYLEPDEERNQAKEYIPLGIKVAKYLRERQPNSYISIVSSSINSLIAKNDLIKFAEIGIINYLDRNVAPYEKFEQQFKYQIKTVEIFLDSKEKKSYWTLICRKMDHDSYRGIVEDFSILSNLILGGTETEFLLKDIGDKDVDMLIAQNLANKDFVNNCNPILLVGKDKDFQEKILISHLTFNKIRNESISGDGSLLPRLFQRIHEAIIDDKKSISDIKKEMQSQKYWEEIGLANVKSFCHENGTLKFHDNRKSIIFFNINLIPKEIVRNITISAGNYIEKVKRDYIQGDQTKK